MKHKKEIAILLPNKEDYTKNLAAAASIWVKDYNKGIIAKKQIIFGNASSAPLSKNFINLKKKNFLNNSYFYILNFINKLPKNINVIVIHNRPHFYFILKKKFPKTKFIFLKFIKFLVNGEALLIPKTICLLAILPLLKSLTQSEAAAALLKE